MTPDPASIVDPETGMSPREAAELIGSPDFAIENAFEGGYLARDQSANASVLFGFDKWQSARTTLRRWHASRALTPDKVRQIAVECTAANNAEGAMDDGINAMAEAIIKYLESNHAE